jgi:hypothetical protein
MLHACLTPIALCFVYTSWHFYAFFGTNLLMRCHSASSLFTAILCIKKVTQEIFSELDETKAEVPIYLTWRRSPKERRRGGRGQPHHKVARATPWPCHQVVWTPGPSPNIAFSTINSFRRENPKGMNTFHETYCKSPPSSSWDREGPEALLGTLPERWIITRGLLHHHASLWSDAWVVYLGLRVHSSS